ncbi:hypothetical protein GCM10007216_30100 [Thalassobacillus devorans]|uniref:DUF3899 domain-containing protein n=1 Tax=Thalassobacillus devorans TaxID=279813 RepID=A0ABQ1PHC0_9BACI|nr:hypothetical protein [Thalassobacillus devorans]NIK29972.1 hypothetical protein [Thalassobacillus devorans]GGC97319.1 hypothetical protein GCM10007216_30100 [Thalassobacillus devorans]
MPDVWIGLLLFIGMALSVYTSLKFTRALVRKGTGLKIARVIYGLLSGAGVAAVMIGLLIIDMGEVESVLMNFPVIAVVFGSIFYFNSKGKHRYRRRGTFRFKKVSYDLLIADINVKKQLKQFPRKMKMAWQDLVEESRVLAFILVLCFLIPVVIGGTGIYFEFIHPIVT